MKKEKKILTSLLSFIMIFVMIVLAPAQVAYAGGVNGTPGSPPPGRGHGSGKNWMWFVWPGGSSTELHAMDGNTGNNRCTTIGLNGGRWGYAKNNAVTSSSTEGARPYDCGVTFDWYGSTYSVAHCTGWPYLSSDAFSWQKMANNVNQKCREVNGYEGTLTATECQQLVDNYMSSRIHDGFFWYDSAQVLMKIDLWELAKDVQPEEWSTSNDVGINQVEESFTWRIRKVYGYNSGTRYYPDDSSLDEYNGISDFKNVTKTKYSASNSPKAMWESSPNLSYTQPASYSVDSRNDSSALYYKIRKWRTRTAVHHTGKHHYHILRHCTSLCYSWDYWTYTPWSSWKYDKVDQKTVSNNSSLNIRTYIPNYNGYKWMDLTSETFTNSTSISYGSGAKPTDYKYTTGYTSGNLNMTLVSGKDAGKKFELLSDNNPKGITLNFNDILGVGGYSTTRPSTKGSEYLVSNNLYYGPTKNAQTSTPVISIQRIISPSRATTENWARGSVAYSGNPLSLETNFRSIKYGTYTLGDAKGTNCWYETVRIAAINKLGSTYEVTAVGSMTSTPTNRAISFNKSKLNEDIGLTASFMQPVLVGDIDVKDAAGN